MLGFLGYRQKSPPAIHILRRPSMDEQVGCQVSRLAPLILELFDKAMNHETDWDAIRDLLRNECTPEMLARMLQRLQSQQFIECLSKTVYGGWRWQADTTPATSLLRVRRAQTLFLAGKELKN
jgi:hypothetical protein